MRTQIATRLARALATRQGTQWGATRSLSANPAPSFDDNEALPAHKDGKVLHPELLNANMRKTQYAVRGELYLKAEQLKNEGKEIIFTNGEAPGAGRASRGAARPYHAPAARSRATRCAPPAACAAAARPQPPRRPPPPPPDTSSHPQRVAATQWATRTTWARSR